MSDGDRSGQTLCPGHVKWGCICIGLQVALLVAVLPVYQVPGICIRAAGLSGSWGRSGADHQMGRRPCSAVQPLPAAVQLASACTGLCSWLHL